MNRKQFLTALAATAMSMAAPPVFAQSSEPIRFLVGFPPGGSTDTIARLLAEKVSTLLRQPVIVENKAGAGGRLAAMTLKSSAPDGLLFMIAPNATPLFQTLLYPPEVLKYDMLKDFAAVAVLASYPLALAVAQRTGVKTVREFQTYLKANAGDASFGTAGAGGHTHFSGLQLGKALGVNLRAVPYRGNGPLATDLLGGQVASGVMTAGDIAQYQKSGKVQVIGVFGATRSPLLPDVPTLMEQGYALDTGDAWTGMWAAAQTPPALLERMENALRHVLALPEVKEVLAKATLSADFRSAKDMDRLQRKELAYWAPVIKASGFTPEQ